jgi:hypothetical protein
MDRSLLFELVQDFRFTLTESFQRVILNVSFDLVFFLIVGQFVDEHSFTLVSPDGNQEDFWLEP